MIEGDAIAAALALVKEHLGDKAVRELVIKLEDAERIKVIRDAFNEGRDRVAVTLMRDLVKWGDLHEGQFKLLPTSASDLIQPGQSVQVTARPQGYAFSALALLVSDQSRGFLINDIRVGNRSQFVQAGDIPADVLTPIPAALEVLFATKPDETVEDAEKRIGERIEVALRSDVLSRAIVPLDCDVCLTSQDMVVVATNVTSEPLFWRAVWLGKDVERPVTEMSPYPYPYAPPIPGTSEE